MEEVLPGLDEATATRVRPALDWLRSQGGERGLDAGLVQRFLTEVLAARTWEDAREHHEVAWALGDLFASAGLAELAALCRSPASHESMAVRAWIASFPDVPQQFWRPALATVQETPAVPARAGLSLVSARALLEEVGEGLPLDEQGQLPLRTVLRLDDRFRWTEEFPWMRVRGEGDIAPLRLLREHLQAQTLLRRTGDRLVVTDLGRGCAEDAEALWRGITDPSPRWSHEFEQDALGVMAASVLRAADFSLSRIAEEMTNVLARKWHPRTHGDRVVFDGAAPLAQAWYQLGVPLGWWDTGRGLADRRPNGFGRAAAAAVIRSVSARHRG